MERHHPSWTLTGVLLLTTVFISTLSTSSQAFATTLYFDNFDNGYSSWSTSGNVSQDNAPCLGPDCVRLKKTGTIWKTLPTTGSSGITVTWNMAAQALENGDFCYVEVNTGSGWQVIASLTNGDDNSVFRSGTVNLSSAADDNASFQVRFRDASNALGDTCYVDDLTIADGGSGGPGGSRGVLTWSDLTTGPGPSSPVDLSAMAEPTNADAPLHTFEGRLVLSGEATTGDWNVLEDDFNYDSVATRQHLPEFDFEFVQDGRDLIPVERGNITTTHPNWTYILGPGRVWSEADDNGDSRASLPFALAQKNANCTHNGVLTFVFNDTSISDVWYEITQETCLYFKFDMWGLADATYISGAVSGAATIKADFQQELADRFPTRNISQLVVDYPGADPSKFGADITATHLSTYGLVIGGVNYTAACNTRHGAYPYCASMRLPSYSTAKSAFASVALMALAEQYGPQVEDLLIKDYVGEHAASPGNWTNVTIGDALDMATGNYRFVTYFRDEGSRQMDDFFLSEDYADRIFEAFDWSNKKSPGITWVYRTSDYFIANRAMHQYLEVQQGTGSDIFEYLVSTVFEPIKIGPGAHTSLRTRDNNWTGQTFGGYGLWWIQDDVAKLATLLNNDGGAAGGNQILHPDLLADALQQDPADRGFDTGRDRMYNNGFWAREFTSADGFACDFWVPFMSGFGGITIALMPNGTTYYYFSDNDEFEWTSAVEGSDSILAMCP